MYTENNLIVTRNVQNVRPMAQTQAYRHVGHWSTVSSISDCSKPCHTHSQQTLSQLSDVINYDLRHMLLNETTNSLLAQSIYSCLQIFKSH